MGRIIVFKPFSQNTDTSNLFLDFCEESKVTPSFDWIHSDISFIAYQKALANFSRNLPSLNGEDSHWLEVSYHWMKRHFYPAMCNSRLLTPLEATDLLDLSTSPGPIWRLRGMTTKREAILGLTSKFFAEHWVKLATRGAPLTYWSANLKDELRQREKVLDNKTRLFLIGPVEHAIAMERIFGDMNARLVAAGRSGRVASCVGVEFFRRFFDRVHSMTADFEEVECADAKKYDSTLLPVFLRGMALFRFECLCESDRTNENALRIYNLYRDIIWTPIILQNGLIIQKEHGNPSGQVNTSTDNTMILYWIYAYVWLRSGGTNDYLDFCRYSKLLLYGDDSVLMRRGLACDVFRRDNLVSGFSSLGMELEFSEHLEFLGHVCCYSPHLSIYVPVLSTERILSSLAQGGRSLPDLTLTRACNLRIVSYTNPEAFRICDAFCKWLMDRFPALDRRSYLPESTLRALHLDMSEVDAPALFALEVLTESTNNHDAPEETETPTQAEQQSPKWTTLQAREPNPDSIRPGRRVQPL